jgi:hypothetical protein
MDLEIIQILDCAGEEFGVVNCAVSIKIKLAYYFLQFLIFHLYMHFFKRFQ